MKILNTQSKQILQTNKEKPYRDKIEHMANNGYASVIIYGKKVYLVDDDIIDDERVIIVEVEGME